MEAILYKSTPIQVVKYIGKGVFVITFQKKNIKDYADDLTFSTNVPHVLNECRIYVCNVLKEMESPKLKLNDKKTVFTSKKHNRRVTGLVLSNDGVVSLGREKKRLIRSQIHYFQNGKLCDKEIYQLRGHLAYALDVEKDFVNRMEKKYGQTIDHIMSYEKSN